MAIGKLKSLKVAGANALDLTWDDGRAARVDLAVVLGKHPALKPIRSRTAFAKAKLSADNWSVEWPGDIDFGSTQLRRWADEQAGEAMPAEDFRRWMEMHALTLDAAAKALGLSRRMVAYYASGEKVVPKTVLLATDGLWGAAGPTPERLLTVEAMAARFHDKSLELVQAIQFEMKSEWARHVVALYASLIEYIGTLLTLTRRRRRAGFASVYRSLLECVVDLQNLLDDKTYIHEMEAKHCRGWVKILDESARGNAYLAGIAKLPVSLRRRVHLEKKLASLERAGFGKMKIREAFQKAGLLLEYTSIYNFESGEAHNDMRALFKRHIQEIGGQARLVVYDDVKDDYFELRLGVAAGYLVGAGIEVHRKFKSGREKALEELQAQYKTKGIMSDLPLDS